MDKERSKRITLAMKSAGFTRDSLALATGYSAGTISNIKAGREFKTDQLLAICAVLEVSPNYILGHDSPNLQSEKIARLSSLITCNETVTAIETILKKIANC